jgi:hypothetical protein
VVAATRYQASPPSGLGDVLSGGLGADPVRRVILDPWRHGLGAALGEALPGRRFGRLEVLRSKFKPGRKLSAYYLLDTSAAPVHLAATWSGVGAGAAGDRCSVLVSPADPTMPQLVRLTDPVHLARSVSDLAGRDDLPSHATSIDTIRYRPGQRHVLRATFGPDRPRVVVKTDRDRSGSRAVPVASAVTALLRSRCPGVLAADALGWLPTDAASVWTVAPGTPLSHRLVHVTTDSTPTVALLGRALRLVHDDTALAEHLRAVGCVLPARDVAAELAATQRAAEHIRVLLPSVGHVVDALVSATAAAVATQPPVAPTLVHGDLKCDNVLTGDPVRLLDLDRAALGDPAADLAKFVADLHWWCSGRLGGASALLAAFRSGYGPGAEDRWVWARTLVPIFQLRFAARRCAVHERDWAARVEALVATAAALSRAEP